MDAQRLDRLARALAGNKPRRWTLKALAAGALSLGLLTHAARSTAAKDAFLQCVEACLALCEHQHNCRVTQPDCAASCSQGLL
jgi:hypothetical protein